jgi:hypothetical protein
MESHLDDLPIRPEEHIKEDISRKKIRDIITDPLFLIREEKDNDYGVDLEVELLMEVHHPTNIRFHVQLKSTTKSINKKNNSISLSVSRTNLNYLLNSPCSYYVIYHIPTNRFYYRSAESVYKKYEKSGNRWSQQQYITIRLHDILDQASVKVIYEQVLNHNKWAKSARLTLCKHAISLSSKIVFDPKKWEITDINMIVSFMQIYGIELVNQGYSKDILSIVEKIPPKDLENGKVLLTLAYANYKNTNFYEAYQYVRRLERIPDQLDADSKEFSQILKLSCRLGLGLINNETYFKEMGTLSNSSTSKSSIYHCKLEDLRFKAMMNHGANLVEIKQLVDALDKEPNEYEPLKIQAELAYLEAEGYSLTTSFIREVRGRIMLKEIGMEGRLFAKTQERARKLIASCKEWHDKFDRLLNRARNFGSPLIIGDIYYTFVSISIQRDWIDSQITANFKNDTHLPKHIKGLREKLVFAQNLFKQHGLSHHYLQTRLLEIDLLWFLDDFTSMKKLAEDIMREADLLGYITIKQRAEKIKNGENPFPDLV